MGKDFNLTVINRENIATDLNNIINSDIHTSININHNLVKKWLMQF
jgi:hypothetical protein